MPFQRGHAKLGGRAKGTPNKRTAARQQALQEALEASRLLPEDVAEMTPLGILLAIARRRFAANDLDGAMAAAEAACPFVHPKLQALAADLSVTSTVAHLSTEQLQAELEALEARDAAGERCKAKAAELATRMPPLPPRPVRAVAANGVRRLTSLDDLD